jgi:NAD(P)-dependent dehydrogenase (short-subunit alcohol dehydrogenase family)
METKMLAGKKIIITGGARRIGKEFAFAVANEGAQVIIHHSRSPLEAQETADLIRNLGGSAEVISADFSDPKNAMLEFERIFSKPDDIFALVNNAAIFEPLKFKDTTLTDWNNHLQINLTVPFLLSQMFARSIEKSKGRIINILDWRALRPGRDHFPYTVSKSALAAMTKALAYTLAPSIQVNGIALGAILPPADGGDNSTIMTSVPANRWSTMKELTDTLLFLLNGPEYITGEIIHLDGGRHLV